MLVLLAFSAAWALVGLSGSRIQYENGPLENIQAACLAAGAVLSLFAALRCREPVRYLYAALALHCLGFFLREFDLEDHDLPSIVIYLGTGKPRYRMLEAMWAVLLIVFFLRHRGDAWRTTRRWLRSDQGLCAIVSFALYVIGMLFDQTTVLGLQWDKLVEELLETNGTILLLVAAVLALLSTRAVTAVRAGEAPAGSGSGAPGPPS